MPLSKYMGQKSDMVMKSMKKTYGEKKGKEVFYKTASKMKKKKKRKVKDMVLSAH